MLSLPRNFMSRKKFKRNFYIHRFADGTMICSGTNGLSKLEIVDGVTSI